MVGKELLHLITLQHIATQAIYFFFFFQLKNSIRFFSLHGTAVMFAVMSDTIPTAVSKNCIITLM